MTQIVVERQMGMAIYPGWEGGLELALSRRQSVTRLTHARHWGPLRVQRPFYPGDSGECHLYLLHPPGGMVTGDSLEMDIQLSDGAAALLTTPSAGKIYRGNATAESQRQVVKLRVSEGSFLQWLPLETIVFEGARGQLSVRVDLDENSHCALWDIVCLGRPASGEAFEQGYLNQRMELFRDGVPIYIESNRFLGGSEMLRGDWGLGDRCVAGSFLVTGDISRDDLEQLRNLVDASESDGDSSGEITAERVAISVMEGVLAMRYLGSSAESCRRTFLKVWNYLKPRLTNEQFLEPRIWHT